MAAEQTDRTANAEAEDFREIFGRTRDRTPASPDEASAWIRSIRRRLEDRTREEET